MIILLILPVPTIFAVLVRGHRHRHLIIAAVALASASAGAAEPELKPYQVTVNAPWYERAAWREYQQARHDRQPAAIGHRPAASEATTAAPAPAPALRYNAINNTHERS